LKSGAKICLLISLNAFVAEEERQLNHIVNDDTEDVAQQKSRKCREKKELNRFTGLEI